MARGILNFSRDLRKHPAAVAAAAEAMTDSYVSMLRMLDFFLGVKRVVIAA